MEYKITEDGRVFKPSGEEVNYHAHPKGYIEVTIKVDGRWKRQKVHRLVAEKYIPNPDELSDVDHINSVRDDNRVENLRWLSHGDNIRHSYDIGNRAATGSKNANCKTTEAAVHEICQLIQKGLKPSKIRDEGYNYSLVRAIKRKQNWSHISDEYF